MRFSKTIEDGIHVGTIDGIREVETSEGRKTVASIIPDNEYGVSFENVNIWGSDIEPQTSVFAQMIRKATEEEILKDEYSIKALEKLLVGCTIEFETQLNHKNGRTFVNVIKVIDVYQEYDPEVESDEDEAGTEDVDDELIEEDDELIEEDDEDEDDEDNDIDQIITSAFKSKKRHKK